jgi:hypothetical protein
VTFPANVNWGGRDGHQLARLMLETDESPAGRVILFVKGNVDNPIAVWPQMFDFGELDPGASNEQLLHVTSSTILSSSCVVSATCDDPCVQIRRLDAPTKDAPNDAATFAVRVVAARTEGPRYCRIRVSTSTSQHQIPAAVKMRSRGAISARPKSLLFHFQKNDVAQDLVVNVRVAAVAGADSNLDAHLTRASALLTVRQMSATVDAGSLNAVLRVSCAPCREPLIFGDLAITHGQDVLNVPIVALGTRQ